jgi:uridine phosphorylase
MKRAWYSGHSAEELGDSAILVGDPDRVERIGALLAEPVFLPVKRGLKTVTGTWNGKRVSVVAFGMGAPIATIVLHEFADLGIRRFVRIGTAMYFPPATGGEFLISDSAIGFDGTSPAYGVPTGEQVSADAALVMALEEASDRCV